MRISFAAGALLAALGSFPAAASAQPGAITPPEATSRVDAVYPPSEAKNGADVLVFLDVVIDTAGHVKSARVQESAGAAFDDAALTAVRQWLFKPAEREGKAIASKIRIPVHFEPPDAHAAFPVESKSANPKAHGDARTAPVIPETHNEEAKAIDAHDSSPENVEVSGRPLPTSRGPSDFLIHIGELGQVPVKNASDLLKLAPGIMLSNAGGDGHAEQVFMRGFDAREGQDIEFSVGGIPINETGNLHANGYADTHFIIPELVDSLRVLEGPFDPRQGNYAVAGSADYQLGLDKRGLSLKLGYGSFGTKRLLLLWGPKEESAHTFAGAELHSTDGYGQNRASERASAMAQYEGKLGERGTYRVFAQGYASDYQSAGLMRADDVANGHKNFYDTYDPRQGGQSTRFSVAGDILVRNGRTDFYEQVFAITRGMRVQENFTGYLLDTQTAAQNPHIQRGDLIDRDVSEQTYGSRGWARTKFKEFGLTQEAELGYFARYDVVDATQYRVESATDRPYQLDISNASKIVDLGLYGDVNLRPHKLIQIKGGLRADLFSFDVLNRCAIKSVRRPSDQNPPGDASCLSQWDFGRYLEPVNRATTSATALMPKVTVSVGPFSGFQFSASYGRGVRSIDPIFVYEDTKTPFATVDSAEGGASYAHSGKNGLLLVRSIFFGTHVDRDLVFSQSEGRNTLANGTTRLGWVGALRFSGSWFDESANVTLVRSTFDDTGLLVPYVPDLVIRDDVAVHAVLPWKPFGETLTGSLASGVSFIGKRALPYGERSDTIFTIDMSAGLRMRGYEFGVAATNITDAKVRQGEYNFASDFQSSPHPSLVPARHFAAGPPRAIFATVAVTVGGN